MNDQFTTAAMEEAKRDGAPGGECPVRKRFAVSLSQGGCFVKNVVYLTTLAREGYLAKE